MSTQSDTSLSVLAWLLRGLLGLGGAWLIFHAWPVAWAAWHAQHADSVVNQMRLGRTIKLADVTAGIESLDRAVQADSSALRRLARSELLLGAGLNQAASDSQRQQWLRLAEADLEAGLAGAPARSIAWLRLASVRYALEGSSTRVVATLLMSIQTGSVNPRLEPIRLELILRNFASLSDSQHVEVDAHVVMIWRYGGIDRLWFVNAARTPLEDLYLRYFLAEVPGAQDELTRLFALRLR